jgi:hypothetical protein
VPADFISHLTETCAWRFSFVCGWAIFYTAAVVVVYIWALNGKCKSRIFTKLLHFHCDWYNVSRWAGEKRLSSTYMCVQRVLVQVLQERARGRYHTLILVHCFCTILSSGSWISYQSRTDSWWRLFLFPTSIYCFWCNSWKDIKFKPHTPISVSPLCNEIAMIKINYRMKLHAGWKKTWGGVDCAANKSAWLMVCISYVSGGT